MFVVLFALACPVCYDECCLCTCESGNSEAYNQLGSMKLCSHLGMMMFENELSSAPAIP